MKKFFVAVVVLAGLAYLCLQIYQKAADSQKNAVRQRPNPPVAVEIAAIEKVTIEEVKSFTA